MTDKKPDVTSNPPKPMELFESPVNALNGDHSVQAEMIQDYAKLILAIAKQPSALIQMQTGYWTDQINLLENFSLRAQGKPARQVAARPTTTSVSRIPSGPTVRRSTRSSKAIFRRSRMPAT